MKKTVAIHQPNYMPWLGYFYKIVNSDIFVFLDNVDFQQGNSSSLTSRTRIKIGDKEQYLTVSVRKNNVSNLIKDIEIDTNKNIFKKHIKTIQFNYSKSDFFKEVFPLLEELLIACSHFKKMHEANEYAIKKIASWLDINTPLVNASDLNLIEEDRNNRIIEICNKLECSVYLSGNGAKKYHEENLFFEKGITINYTSFQVKNYRQSEGEFIPGLSILDVLLNCGIKGTRDLLNADMPSK